MIKSTLKKIPERLNDIAELPKFIQENNIKLFPKEEMSVLDLINYYIETNKTDEAFFIVDLGCILEQYKAWKTLFPKIQPYYSVRCCPDNMIIKILSLLGCGFSCASKQEIITVNAEENCSDRIIYSNPVKDPSFMKYARSQDVDFMSFDSETELYKIKLYHPYAKLLLHITTAHFFEKDTDNRKFGCSMETAKSLLEQCKFLELNVYGVSFNAGKKLCDASVYEGAIKAAKEVFNIAKELGIEMKCLNIGDGFYGQGGSNITKVQEVAKRINESLDKHFGDIEDLRIIAEPGRFLVESSHTLVFNVIGKKKIDNGSETMFSYYMNEGIYGCFNCIMFDDAKPEISPFSERNEKTYKSIIFGPTCDSIDTIARDIYLPELVVGEWCYVEHFGAFTRASASTFNGFQKTPASYVILY